MKTHKIIALIICILICTSACHSQTITKHDLFLYFKEGLSKDIYKGYENLNLGNSKEEKVDVYCYRLNKRKDGKRLVLAYLPIDPKKFKYKDGNFVQSTVKTIEQVKEIDALKYDISDKRFPFKRVYIVEQLSLDRYKVIQVTSYLGSNYYP